jgi:hypothetical protein
VATLLSEINPKKYQPYLKQEKRTTSHICQAQKMPIRDPQGCPAVLGGPIWSLEGVGFETNEYDKCDMNRIIRGKQCTILWHVDDLKISHEHPEVVTDILEALWESIQAIINKRKET